MHDWSALHLCLGQFNEDPALPAPPPHPLPKPLPLSCPNSVVAMFVGALLQGARGTRLTASAITIQAAYRGMAARRELRRARTAARKIQVSSCFLVVPLVCGSADALYMPLQYVLASADS